MLRIAIISVAPHDLFINSFDVDWNRQGFEFELFDHVRRDALRKDSDHVIAAKNARHHRKILNRQHDVPVPSDLGKHARASRAGQRLN